MDVASFAEIEEEFAARVSRIVWCTVATVDRQGRPRSRILHPIWEGSTGWIATGRHSLKEKHLAANPYLSISYWDQEHQQVYVDAKAEWQDDQAEKLRIWDLYKNTPGALRLRSCHHLAGRPRRPRVRSAQGDAVARRTLRA